MVDEGLMNKNTAATPRRYIFTNLTMFLFFVVMKFGFFV